MLDAPFFIDAEQLSAFYDAVVQPPGKWDESVKLEITEEKTREINTSLGLDVNPLSMFGSLNAVLNPVEAGIGASAKSGKSKAETKTQSLELTPIETPQRQLIQLTSQYLVNYPNRIFFVEDVEREADWYREEEIREVPRGLVFLDLPSESEAENNNVPKTKLIPMAVEFEDGRIVTLYDKLGATRKNDSWGPFIENFTPEEAIKEIEETTEGEGRIQWINFRLPLDEHSTARIHFEPHGKYNNGTFAYNLVKLGYKHGLRLVGTVQAEPDVRVLAGYRK